MEITYWYWSHNDESEINKVEKLIAFAEESDDINDEIKWEKIIGFTEECDDINDEIKWGEIVVSAEESNDINEIKWGEIIGFAEESDDINVNQNSYICAQNIYSIKGTYHISFIGICRRYLNKMLEIFVDIREANR
ncbi:MAG: hypothetical protein GY760_16870 [Deltaproteobacteria bacterium]|nr:hypothetical protein [Deltaproteobacteria bacterium]